MQNPRRFARLCLALLFILAPRALPAATSGDVVAKYVAWRGGEAFRKMNSFYEEGRQDALGAVASFRRWNRSDGTFRAELDYGPLRQTLVASDKAWQQLNGRLTSFEEEDARQERNLARLQFACIFEGCGGAAVSSEGQTMLDGRRWSIVRVRFPGTTTWYDLMMDPNSGALGAVVQRSGSEENIISFGEWRAVNGVRFPLNIQSRAADGSIQRSTRTNVIPGKGLPEDLVRKPTLPAKTYFSGGSATGPLPMNLLQGRRIYVPATVNGVAVDALLDSGAAWTVIDTRFAERIGLRTFGSRMTKGTGGQAPSQYGAGVSASVGRLHLDDLMVLVMDLSEVEKRLGVPLPVILGREAFDEAIVDLDFVKRQIAFYDPVGFTAPKAAVSIPFPEVEGHRAVPVSIEGSEPLPFVFDTGNGSIPLSIYPSFPGRSAFLQARPNSQILSGAIGGSRRASIATLKSVSFAGAEFTNVPAIFQPVDSSASSSTKFFGNIGMQILGRFRLITDHRRSRLWAIAQESQVSKPFVKDRLGLMGTSSSEGLKINFVAPASPAAAAGLKAGQVITFINGAAPPVDAGSLPNLGFADGPTILKITLSDGTSTTLKLQDYY